MPKIEIFPCYKQAFLEKDLETFEQLMRLTSNSVFKSNRHRSVVKFSLWFDDQETDFFCKRHFKPENKDKWRDLFALHWPLSDGKQELENISRLSALGIPTMKPAAWGEEEGVGFNRKSFLVTQSLGNLPRLEDYLREKYAGKLNPKQSREKRNLILQVAELAQKFHAAHLCHRDFYCGHLLVETQKSGSPILYLIDLQRVRQHRYLRRRWQTKDLAALNFTADPKAVSKTDRLRFFLAYTGSKRLTPSLKRWIGQIERRTQKSARHTAKKRQKYLSKKE